MDRATVLIDSTAGKPPHDVAQPHGPHGRLMVLTLGALGVVYGDIGTSPLYAVNQIFFGLGDLPITADNVHGAISLVVWALTLVVAWTSRVRVLGADPAGAGGGYPLRASASL